MQPAGPALRITRALRIVPAPGPHLRPQVGLSLDPGAVAVVGDHHTPGEAGSGGGPRAEPVIPTVAALQDWPRPSVHSSSAPPAPGTTGHPAWGCTRERRGREAPGQVSTHLRPFSPGGGEHRPQARCPARGRLGPRQCLGRRGPRARAPWLCEGSVGQAGPTPSLGAAGRSRLSIEDLREQPRPGNGRPSEGTWDVGAQWAFPGPAGGGRAPPAGRLEEGSSRARGL